MATLKRSECDWAGVGVLLEREGRIGEVGHRQLVAQTLTGGQATTACRWRELDNSLRFDVTAAVGDEGRSRDDAGRSRGRSPWTYARGS